jgi:hypothetical protein
LREPETARKRQPIHARSDARAPTIVGLPRERATTTAMVALMHAIDDSSLPELPDETVAGTPVADGDYDFDLDLDDDDDFDDDDEDDDEDEDEEEEDEDDEEDEDREPWDDEEGEEE